MQYSISTLLVFVTLVSVTAHAIRLSHLRANLEREVRRHVSSSERLSVEETELLLDLYQQALVHEPIIDLEIKARQKFRQQLTSDPCDAATP